VPDIGLGEIIVIVVVALLVFGPDRLPKVAADAARMLRQVRLMAASARKDLVDAAGLEDDAEMSQTLRDLRDLDPRRAMQGVLSDDPTPTGPGSAQRPGRGAQGSEAGPGPGGPPAEGTGAVSGAASASGAGPVSGAASASAAGVQPVAPPIVAPAQADPDWT
jgi:sec-independent protein translocase protein TatB